MILDLSILVFCCLIYCINRFILKDSISIHYLSYFLNNHLNDCIAGLAIVSYTNVIALHFNRCKAINSIVSILIFTFICGILWEYIFPRIYSRGTSDFFDVLSYMSGGIFYKSIIFVTHLVQRRSNHKNSIN